MDHKVTLVPTKTCVNTPKITVAVDHVHVAPVIHAKPCVNSPQITVTVYRIVSSAFSEVIKGPQASDTGFNKSSYDRASNLQNPKVLKNYNSVTALWIIIGVTVGLAVLVMIIYFNTKK